MPLFNGVDRPDIELETCLPKSPVPAESLAFQSKQTAKVTLPVLQPTCQLS